MQFITLNDGNKMPILGYGVFQIDPKETTKCVLDAISIGYRLIDTAQAYFNESEVGEAVKSSGVRRDELFLTTKIWINNLVNSDKILKSIETSLKNLKTDYLDLLLIHQPYGDIYEALRVMKALKDEGILKSIGVSNFYADRIVDICELSGVIPAVNQVECHPFYQRKALKNVLDSYDVVMQSWASFAEGKNEIFNNETLSKIAKKHDKSVAQVILRFLVQQNIVVIPKSVKIERMRENFDIFGFALDELDMAEILSLDMDKTLFFNHDDPQMAKWIINYHKDKF